jgi:hypothetical protein
LVLGVPLSPHRLHHLQVEERGGRDQEEDQGEAGETGDRDKERAHEEASSSKASIRRRNDSLKMC